MNLRSIDLNLLVILDALLEEGHVTRAAERVCLSQPATSAALDRCRALFDDPLLERGPGGMRLTRKAEALREPLKAVLASVGGLLAPRAPDPSTVVSTVRVVMSDFPAVGVARMLIEHLQSSAPGIDLVLLPWRGGQDATESLRRGDSDLAVSVLPALDANFRRVLLLNETFVVAMRPGHPAAQDFNLQSWLAWPHILVSGRGDTTSPLDNTLADLGLRRRVGIVVPSFMMALPLLHDSNLIVMLPSRCVPRTAEAAWAVFAPPLPVDGFPLHLAWHRRSDEDVAVRHVAAIIQEVLA